MHLTTITQPQQFLGLHDEWNLLLSSQDSCPLSLTHEWVSAWWNEFNKNRQLNILCIHENNKLLAIAPFYKEKTTYRGIPIQRLHLLVDGHSPYSDIIYDYTLSDKKISKILSLLIEENQGELMVFAKLPKVSTTYNLLTKPIYPEQYNIIRKQSLKTPIIRISGEWDDFFNKRSRKFHKSINNKLNRFKKEPDFTIECPFITSCNSPVLKEIVEISTKSWKASTKSDLKSDIDGKEFLFDLVKAFGPSKQIQIWIIRKNLIPVAYEFHVIFDQIVYPIRADYDENYKKYSPGSILEYTALKYLFEEKKVTKYYSCADDYWYLNNWTNESKEHYTVEVFSSNIKAHSLYFFEKYVAPIARYIKSKLPTRKKPNKLQ